MGKLNTIFSVFRHSCAGRNLLDFSPVGLIEDILNEIPAFAGMTENF